MLTILILITITFLQVTGLYSDFLPFYCWKWAGLEVCALERSVIRKGACTLGPTWIIETIFEIREILFGTWVPISRKSGEFFSLFSFNLKSLRCGGVWALSIFLYPFQVNYSPRMAKKRCAFAQKLVMANRDLGGNLSVAHQHNPNLHQ